MAPLINAASGAEALIPRPMTVAAGAPPPLAAANSIRMSVRSSRGAGKGAGQAVHYGPLGCLNRFLRERFQPGPADVFPDSPGDVQSRPP